MKDVKIENNKILVKEIKENLNKGRGMPWNIQI